MIHQAQQIPKRKGQRWHFSKIGLSLLIIFITFQDCTAKPEEVSQIKSKNSITKVQPIPQQNRIRRSAKYTEETLAIGRESHFNILALSGLTKNAENLSKLQSKHEACNRPSISCNGAFPYRRTDGRCNNLKNKDWGSPYTNYRRLVPAAYADGFNAPRGQPPDKPLPNPRLISATVHRDFINPDSTLTNMVPQIGQFLDHDMTLAPETDRRCCTTEINGIDCWPVEIPDNDDFYSKLSQRQTCMDFTRSTAFCFPSSSGVREQFNMNTAFIDGSQIYGSSEERSRYLREFSGGRLLTNSESNIPPSVEQVLGIGLSENYMGKLIAGDDRVNETPGLTIIHTLWLREHNRIAALFETAKPDWKDEKIYQETRRIVVGEWENVVFGHFLPIVMGPNAMKMWKLDLGNIDTFSDYDANLNPTILHPFATAAYRFGHTLVNGLFRLFRGDREVGGFMLRNTFFNSTHIETPGAYDRTLAGLMVQNAQTYDRHVTEDITNFLYKMEAESFGADLVARNIQRGRDHGISSYDTYRQICGLRPLTTWDEKPDEMDYDSWEKLQILYDLPTDIDLFTGGLTESPATYAEGGGITGPTFNCLKGRQFQASKFGDRYFFTHRNQASSFTKKQLGLIRKRTLGDLICENSEIQRTTANVFKIPSDENPWLSCSDSSRIQIRVEDFAD